MTGDTISLGVQTGGEDDRMLTPVRAIRKVLRTCCAGPYSPEVREFALCLRVGTNMQEFDFAGCERIRRNRKKGYITLDLALPRDQWKDATESVLWERIADVVETGLLCCINRLQKDKTPIDAERLMHDFAKARAQFLSMIPHTSSPDN